MHFGDWLKRRIEEKTYSQTEFAVEAKIPFWTLRNWLKQAEPPIVGRNRVKLAKALGITREELERQLGEDPRPAAPVETKAAELLPEDQRELKVLISENDLSFLAPRYPGREIVVWASNVLTREIAKERGRARGGRSRTRRSR